MAEAELEEEVFEEEGLEEAVSSAREVKARNRCRWALRTSYIGKKFGSFARAVDILRDFGWSDKQILALSGTEEAIDLLERGVLR